MRIRFDRQPLPGVTVLLTLLAGCGDANTEPPSSAGGKTSSGGASQTGGATSQLGGATSVGGSMAGAWTLGGTSQGGAATGGNTQSSGGVSASGGNSTGGSASGGKSTSGGTSQGGASSKGGAPNGGTASGGASGGSSARGGASSALGGSTSSGGSGGGNCETPPAPSALVGWAAVSGNGVTTTTGGGNATPVTVSSLSELQNAVKGSTAAVIHVKGKLSPGNISVGSNKTIVGLCGAEIHGHLELGGSVNVIVRNIKIVGYAVGNCKLDPDYDASEGCSSGSDAISVQKNAHHIWFDHCDVSDGTDGNLDITNGANYVTVSWTKFHYTARTDNEGGDSTGAAGHRYSNLVGGTDSPDDYDDANALNVTWHHNWWADRVVERQPRVRFGHNHLFNNLWSSSGNNYCVRAGKSAHILIENSHFEGVDSPHEFNNSSDEGTAFITVKDNVYESTTGEKATGGKGTPFAGKYEYTAEPAASVEAAVRSGAGPR